jgi:hypothetical protein
MNPIGTRSRKKPRNPRNPRTPAKQPPKPLPAANEGEPTVTNQDTTPTTVALEDTDSEARLLYWHSTANGAAREAAEREQAAFDKRDVHERAVANFEATRQELLAQLDDVSRQQEAAKSAAVKANEVGQQHTAARVKAEKSVRDARRMCEAAGVDPDQAALPPARPSLPPPAPAPEPAPNGTKTTLMDLRAEQGVARLIAHHEADPAGESGAE